MRSLRNNAGIPAIKAAFMMPRAKIFRLIEMKPGFNDR
jgi:hypothetical protein